MLGMAINDVNRCEFLMSPKGLIGQSAMAMQEALPGPGGAATLVVFFPHFGPRKDGAEFLADGGEEGAAGQVCGVHGHGLDSDPNKEPALM